MFVKFATSSINAFVVQLRGLWHTPSLQPESDHVASAVDGSLFLVLEDLVVPSPCFFRFFFTFVSCAVDSDPRNEFLSRLVRLLSLTEDSLVLLLFFLGL